MKRGLQRLAGFPNISRDPTYSGRTLFLKLSQRSHMSQSLVDADPPIMLFTLETNYR